MKIRNVMKICIVLGFALWLTAFWSVNVLSVESSSKTAVNKELQKDVGMPVLDGDLWQKMTQDDKIAFIWGVWTVVSIENYLMDKYPQLRIENFSAKVIEASRKTPKTADEIVALIDTYYRTNPDEIEKPVVGVLWDVMIKPGIETGIAGRPLKGANKPEGEMK